MATDLYARLTHEEYKIFEEQLLQYQKLETAHTSVEGFYHKSFRLRVGDITLEVHGPLVKTG
ncbi:hypothetical protein LCGC14_0295250 [marine sediment metagenome]|uniref:Uncharacterized protein n=1 Tax=marine sediment metagenome TaxID=412755 RepID=A0A0F9U964_9ZZZZ